ncbi:elongation factor P-like protein EfpL [Pelagibaculum spongiae]|uniref:Elongation factor P-like protein YeiP n=1 Tax=Pelagibaculum spongiae TaxID=2080658 RepID=A0A2V1GNT9_9GAMM|nr:elongation factor P [Pelagibaculum spongiae]PVZ63900.1 elongation factor P-like protein YeiP [Pelagibaculum spongiae]
MPKACDIKRGEVVDINGQPCQLKDITVHSPSARGAATLYKCRFTDLLKKQKVDQTFTGDDFLKPIDTSKKPVQFLYKEDASYVLMDLESYEQFYLDAEVLGDQAQWLSDTLEGMFGLLIEDQLVSIELPNSLVLEIVETPPAMKGSSQNKRTKPATLENGAVVQVPEYISTGEKINVNPELQTFLSRA